MFVCARLCHGQESTQRGQTASLANPGSLVSHERGAPHCFSLPCFPQTIAAGKELVRRIQRAGFQVHIYTLRNEAK
jgi:glycerophosphoryl diester phosphodiesterase